MLTLDDRKGEFEKLCHTKMRNGGLHYPESGLEQSVIMGEPTSVYLSAQLSQLAEEIVREMPEAKIDRHETYCSCDSCGYRQIEIDEATGYNQCRQRIIDALTQAGFLPKV